MNLFTYEKIKKTVAVLLALSALSVSFTACRNNTANNDGSLTKTENSTDITDTNTEIELPANENKKEEIIINENYADSELIDFEGTIDEIYDDGSMLIYSPFFGVSFDYKAIVELDENSVIDGFEPKVNQCVKFNVYSAVKKSEPLTVVASSLSLVKEVSTQREEEAARKHKVQENLNKYTSVQD